VPALPTSTVNDLLAILVAEAASPLKSESDGQMAMGRQLRDILDAVRAVQSPRGSAWGRVRMAAVKFPGASPR
jgi:hypothetical protein